LPSAMLLLELLLLIIMISIPLIPFLWAWLKGSKKLKILHEKYCRALEVTFRRLLGASTSFTIISPLESVYEATNRVKVAGKVWLADRRAYFYYFAKIFRPINDMISFSISTSFTPGCCLIIVSRERGKLVEQALAYTEQLEYVDIRGLKDYFILTDNVVGIRHILDEFIVQELVNMKKKILYIVMDYTAPNVEFYIETNEKDYTMVIPRAVMLIKNIMDRAGRISPRRETIDTIKKLKRALRPRE